MKISLYKLQEFIFSLLVLFLPIQLGLHFWPAYTHILGIRIDYLSPTVYFTDILIGMLFVLWIAQNFILVIARSPQSRRTTKQSNKIATLSSFARNDIKNIKLFIFLLFISLGIVFSKVPQAGAYGLIKLFEYVFLGFYISHQKRLNMSRIIFLFSIGVLFESSLAIAQFYFQHSLQGAFYFFGERYFNPQTPGVANASINGILMLRPYGTFPHPNVLAGYLLIAMQLINGELKVEKGKLRKGIYIAVLLLGSIALFLTMSRVAMLLHALSFFYWLFQFLRNTRRNFFIGLLVVLVCIGSIFATPLSYRFSGLQLSDESIVQRIDLIHATFGMISDHSLVGVGLNNFLIELPHYLKSQGNTFLLQPVHDIYLLIFAETGVVGFAFFVWFLIRTIKIQSSKFKVQNYSSKFKNRTFQYNNLLLNLLTILIIGLFDHYFLTLQQGQLLFTFILGLCYNKDSA